MKKDNDLILDISLRELKDRVLNFSGGPLLILAPPQVNLQKIMLAKIEAIIREMADDHFQILYLTTKKIMSDQIQKRLNVNYPQISDQVNASTFYTFCENILRKRGYHINIKSDFAIYSREEDIDQIFKDISEVDTIDYKYYIQYLQRRLIEPGDSFAEVFDDPLLSEKVRRAYKKYVTRLEELNALDRDSLFYKTHQLLTKYPFVAKHYQMIYPYIFIEDLQSLTEVQLKILEYLSRGNLENLLASSSTDRNKAEIALKWYRRSRTTIFRVLPIANCHQSSSYDEILKKVKLVSSLQESSNWLLEDIKGRRKNKNLRTIILFEKKSLLEKFYKILEKENIPLLRLSTEFVSPEFRFIKAFLTLANKRNDHEALLDLLSNLKKLKRDISIEYDKIIMSGEAVKVDLFQECVSQLKKQNVISELSGLIDQNGIQDFQKVIQGILDDFLKERRQTVDFSDDLKKWKRIWTNINLNYSEELDLNDFLKQLDDQLQHYNDENRFIQCSTIREYKGEVYHEAYFVFRNQKRLDNFIARIGPDQVAPSFTIIVFTK